MSALPSFLYRRPTAWVLAGVVTAAYAWWVFLMPGEVFWAGDMGVKYVQVQSLWRHHWRPVTLDYPSKDLDPEGRWFPFAPPFVTRRGNEFCSVFPIAFTALSAAPFWLLGAYGLYVIPIAASAVTLCLVPGLCDRLGISQFRALAPILIGLGTPLFFYSVLFWEHTIAVALCTLAAWCLLRVEDRPRMQSPLTAGVLLGLCAWFRPEAYCFVAALVVAVAVTARRLRDGMRLGAWLIAGAAGPCAFLWLYQWWAFGNPLGAHYAVNARYYAEQGLPPITERLIRLLANPNIDEVKNLWIMTPFLLLLVGCAAPPLSRRSSLLAVLICLCVPTSVLLGVTSYFKEGILAVTPLAACCFFLLLPNRRPAAKQRLVGLFAVTCIMFIGSVAITSPVVGGLQYGPRLLLPMFPLLVILTLCGVCAAHEAVMSRKARQVMVCCAFVLGCCGIVGAIRALQTVYTMKTYRRALIQKIRESGQCAIVFDHWSPPQEIAPLYFERRLLLAPHGKDDAELVRALADAGLDGFLFLRRDNEGRLVNDRGRFVHVGGTRLLHGEWLRAVDLTMQWYEIEDGRVNQTPNQVR